MVGRTLVVAPHPDDEILGCGGMLLRRKAEGTQVAWLIVTGISVEFGWSEEKVKQRASEIRRVSELFDFDEVFTLDFPTTQLDRLPMSDLVAGISEVFRSFEPEEVFVPHPSDVHTDHRIVFDAAASCTKWFRYPSVKRVLAYETLSETDFSLGTYSVFRPNVFVDIESFLEEKLRVMSIYESELGAFPFPRSHEAIRALAILRGAASGFRAAEAFELLRERS
jgi:LmbE family N-acetylglucosaminyl deacetylase